MFGTFPKELLEAAALDGAGKWPHRCGGSCCPISRRTLSVLLIFFFIWTWNEFLIPLIFLISNDNQTVPVALASLQGDRLMDVTDHERLGAARRPPGAHLLPHLPAHPHARHHRRCGEVTGCRGIHSKGGIRSKGHAPTMKFTDGYWQLRPGVSRSTPARSHDVGPTATTGCRSSRPPA